MDKEELELFIQSVLPMSIEKASLIASKFEFLKLNKNEILLQENKISAYTWILIKGYVRSFTYDMNGDEVITNIYTHGCFVNDFLSFFKRQPAKASFETITDCILWKLSYDDVQENFHTIPEFREFGRLLLVNNYARLEERMMGIIKENGETRYLKLIKKHPEIFQYVPLKCIASFLGLTDTSLSRIRKEISNKSI